MPVSRLPDPDEDGRPPAQLGSVLDRVLAGLGAPPAPVLTTLAERWEDLVGPLMAANSRPGAVQDGCLRVEVGGPAWASQMRWLQADVLTRIAALVGPEVVTSMDVRVSSR